MLYIAIAIHILGHLIFAFIFKVKLKEIQSLPLFKRLTVEMGGVLTSLTLAFLIITILTINEKETYLLNENAIYGIEVSQEAENIGFKIGDQIIRINNEEIERFSNIVPQILLGPENVIVEISRANKDTSIQITNKDKMNLMKSANSTHFSPIIQSETTGKQIEWSSRQKNFNDAIQLYALSFSHWKNQLNSFVFHKSGNQGSFIVLDQTNLTVKKSARLIALFCILIGMINLLPIPGFDVGNSIIAIIEHKRKKKFNMYNTPQYSDR